jgi:hypothetical protein
VTRHGRRREAATANRVPPSAERVQRVTGAPGDGSSVPPQTWVLACPHLVGAGVAGVVTLKPAAARTYRLRGSSETFEVRSLFVCAACCELAEKHIGGRLRLDLDTFGVGRAGALEGLEP